MTTGTWDRRARRIEADEEAIRARRSVGSMRSWGSRTWDSHPPPLPPDEQGTRLAERRPNGAVPRLGYLTKEEAACCMALVDDLGRPPIGFCGPDCERRPR